MKSLENINGSGVGEGPIAFQRFLRQIPVSDVTGWRWEKLGWIKTVNIAGRRYVTRAAVDEFNRRAVAGEFSRFHPTPTRPKASKEDFAHA
jgi:hypothetical protein